MTNNIFVPQKFNGERMVNVNVSNRKGVIAPTSMTTIDTNSSNSNSNTTTNNNNNAATRQRTPANTQNGEINTSNNNIKVNSPSANFSTSPTPVVGPQEESEERTTSQKYWSEANVAILIQLHRKYFTTDNINNNVNWAQLTTEYNSITSDYRPKKSIIKKWDKLLRKYNAERSCILQQQKNKNVTQSMPLVSYWNHFQYMDSYLNHLPIPDDILYKNTRYEEDSNDDYDDVVIARNKRPQQSYNEHDEEQQRKRVPPLVDSKLQSLESQRILMEQTLQSQMKMMQKSFDSMSKMNMKFVEICEKTTLKSQANETRYLDLLEKYMDNKLLEKKDSGSSSSIPPPSPRTQRERNNQAQEEEEDTDHLF